MCKAVSKQCLWFLQFYFLCPSHLLFALSLQCWIAIITLSPTIFEIEIHSEDNILDNCHNGVRVGNIKWMESDETHVTMQVVVHLAYAQCKLRNVCNVCCIITIIVKKLALRISTTIFRKTCIAITFIILFRMFLDVYSSPFRFI